MKFGFMMVKETLLINIYKYIDIIYKYFYFITSFNISNDD